MDIQPQSQQPISDDQELAKVLAGVNQQANAATPAADTETSTLPPAPQDDQPVIPEPPIEPVVPDSSTLPPAAPAVMSGDSNLDTIKKDALSELRPLVDKLNVAPEEKFDTYLLLLRSTDDKALIAPAHEAARNIADEARRAQALLDIIKEIDYLSNPQSAA